MHCFSPKKKHCFLKCADVTCIKMMFPSDNLHYCVPLLNCDTNVGKIEEVKLTEVGRKCTSFSYLLPHSINQFFAEFRK